MRKLLTAFSLLVCGLAVYWFFRPEVAVFHELGLHNPRPCAASGPISSLLKNHFADAAWCAAAFLAARFLRERNFPRCYGSFLLVLPFLSEGGQAAGIIPGTFDGIDLLLYVALFFFFFGKEILPMQPFRKHVVGGVLLVIFLAAVIGSSGPHYKYENGTFRLPPQPKDEIWTKPALSEILKSSSNHSIVLRVPNTSEKVTEEKVQQNNVLYGTIEKELAKSGFTVRDRQLFAKVLDQGSLDYSKIGVLTETDLILELVRFDTKTYYFDEYKTESGEIKKTPKAMSFTGAVIEFKLTGVKENDIVGTMLFNYTPCTDGCTRRFSPELYGSADTLLNVEEVSRDFALRLIAQLNQYK